MGTPSSVVHAVFEMSERQGEQPAHWTPKNETYALSTWKDLATRVRLLALGLRKRGLKRGDVVLVSLSNRTEWPLIELAAMSLGGVAVGVDVNLNRDRLAEIIEHCDARWLFLETSLEWEAVRPHLKQPDRPIERVWVEPSPSSETTHLAELMTQGAQEDDSAYWSELASLTPDTLAKLVYGSLEGEGLKAVQLSHQNLVWAARRLLDSMQLRGDELVLLSHTPLSNMTEYLCSVVGPALEGYPIFFTTGQTKIEAALRHVRPSALFVVPRVWETLKETLELEISSMSWLQKRTLEWARSIASRCSFMRLAGERVPLDLELKLETAEAIILRPLKAKLGLDRAKFVFAGVSSVAPSVLEFFASIGLIVRELYGQAECTGVIALNTPEETRLGTVGYPLLGVEVRLTQMGEICVRGPNVTTGYHRDPEATQALFENGWLRTGDLGEFDEQGHLRLMGRCRDFLVTSSGSKVARRPIEEKLEKVFGIEKAWLVGDGRAELGALLSPQREQARQWAISLAHPESSLDLEGDSDFRRHIGRLIEEEVNGELPPHERIRRIAFVAPNEKAPIEKAHSEVASGSRTGASVYRDAIERLYSDSHAIVQESE